MVKCPFCGGEVIRTEISAGADGIEESACCWMPTELIDNRDVLSALPEGLQRAAIEGKRAEREALYAKWRKDAAAFKKWRAESLQRWPHLFEMTEKGEKGLWQSKA